MEGRFGWWSCGGNYYDSINQFLNAEKSIRLRSRIKSNQLTVKEIREIFAENKNNRSDAKNKSTLFIDCLSNVKDICETDSGLIYYIAGFVAKKMCKVMKIKSCVSCQLLVKKSNEELTPTFGMNGNELQVESTSNNNREFLSRLNRGGLIEPSHLLSLL